MGTSASVRSRISWNADPRNDFRGVPASISVVRPQEDAFPMQGEVIDPQIVEPTLEKTASVWERQARRCKSQQQY